MSLDLGNAKVRHLESSAPVVRPEPQSPSTPATPHAPLPALVPVSEQYEKLVLASKWKQRQLTGAHLERLSLIQLQCVAQEFCKLVSSEMTNLFYCTDF